MREREKERKNVRKKSQIVCVSERHNRYHSWVLLFILNRKLPSSRKVTFEKANEIKKIAYLKDRLKRGHRGVDAGCVSDGLRHVIGGAVIVHAHQHPLVLVYMRVCTCRRRCASTHRERAHKQDGTNKGI